MILEPRIGMKVRLVDVEALNISAQHAGKCGEVMSDLWIGEKGAQWGSVRTKNGTLWNVKKENMQPVTLKDRQTEALLQSIARYDRIAHGIESYADGECACCELDEEVNSGTRDCTETCPIYAFTGFQECGGTPWKGFSRFFHNRALHEWQPGDFETVEKEIEFLISLLPVEEQERFDLSEVEVMAVKKVEMVKCPRSEECQGCTCGHNAEHVRDAACDSMWGDCPKCQPVEKKPKCGDWVYYKGERVLFLQDDGDTSIPVEIFIPSEEGENWVERDEISLTPQAKELKKPELKKGQPIWVRDADDQEWKPRFFETFFGDDGVMTVHNSLWAGAGGPQLTWNQWKLPTRSELKSAGFDVDFWKWED